MAAVLGMLDLDKNPNRSDSVPEFTQLIWSKEGFEPWPGFPKPTSCSASHIPQWGEDDTLPGKAASPLRSLKATILLVLEKTQSKWSSDSLSSQILPRLCLEQLPLCHQPAFHGWGAHHSAEALGLNSGVCWAMIRFMHFE